MMRTLQNPVVVSVNSTDKVRHLGYFCSLTELFTMNKHAMYCTNILYPVAVKDESTLFDTMKESYTHRSYISVFVLFSSNGS